MALHMKLLLGIVLMLQGAGRCFADTLTPPAPYVGEWNFTGDTRYGLCMKLRAGIRLDITYATHNGTNVSTILSDSHVIVDQQSSHCGNSSLDRNQTLALKFSDERNLELYFTRDPHTTGDDRGIRWQLYKVEFQFVYDNQTFPDSQDAGQSAVLTNLNRTLSGIATSVDRSFMCSKTGAIEVTTGFKIFFTGLKVQAFITKDDFSTADHCAADQDTTDLIPIIVGAALAALVIIVLIAYLIGRARANTPTYDNMK